MLRAMNSHPSPFSPAARRHLDDRLGAFAGAILDPERAVPAGLVGPDGQPSARRFAVYRNNVVVGLCETLKAAYPVVRRLVGDTFFLAMARAHVARTPPATPIMLDYGADFPAFIRSFEPADTLPYLSDVARLERGWVEAYHAPDASPIDLAAFGTIAPDALPRLRLTLHPSLRLLRSSYPILSIWQANTEGEAPGPIDLASGGDDVLVLRPEATVELRRLPPGAAAFIGSLAEDASVIEAAATALAEDASFDLAGSLAALLSSGAVVGHSMDAGGLPVRDRS